MPLLGVMGSSGPLGPFWRPPWELIGPGFLKRIGPLREEVLRGALLFRSLILAHARGSAPRRFEAGRTRFGTAWGWPTWLPRSEDGPVPVWVGQSIFQFNGAMCPVRVAPAFQYLGMLLDVVTFRSLGIFALQNLLLVLIGLCGIWAAYLGLRALLPGREWFAAGLAALFVSCPGVLGPLVRLDLVMSWRPCR